MKIKNFIILFIIILSGIVANFGYLWLHNSNFEVGLFCGDGFTECYDVTKRWIKYHTIIIFIIYGLFILFASKKPPFKIEIYFWLISLTLTMNLFHWNDINSSWGVLALPLNSFLLLYFLFFKSNIKTYFYVSILFYFLIYLYVMFIISELFYYNQNYNKYENCLYIYHTVLFLFFVIFRIRDILKISSKIK